MDINEIKSEIDNWLKNYFTDKGTYNKSIYEAMSYSVNIGGKRIRPILLILVYSLYCDNYEDVIPISASIEMIHTYSLIHDDLPCMDNDDLRRGKPTNHKIFGEAIATLAGDGLLNEAVNVMFNYCIDKGKNELSACKTITEAAGADGMIAGQVVDILSEGRKIDKEELYYMHRKKTGELITASVLAGAHLAGAEERDLRILSSFGEKLGLAFQIKDDILDVIGNTELLGKKVNSDENNNKSTFVTCFDIEYCEIMCKELTIECVDLLNRLDRNTNTLKQLTKMLLEREK
ncbi:MAG: polyprenyl synthetase family protein [Bacillota bacterium]|nr:polyprenyl synthetase family protein [Bacillota bacterium]